MRGCPRTTWLWCGVARVLVVAALAVVTVAGAALAAPGSTGGGAGFEPAPVSENDPLEPVNRLTFELNRQVLWYVARPLAKTWRWVVPRPLRDGLRNGLDNLNSPLRFGNQVLQGDAGAASRTVARLFVNTTLGMGGLIDVAWRLGIPRRETDLGLTLGTWGVGEGPYLVLPLLGPSTPRDAFGAFAQGGADPFNLLVQNTDFAFYAFLVRFVVGNVDLYARRINELDEIEESSVDFYASLRNLYRQKRRADIRKILAEDVSPPSGIDYDVDLDEEDEPEALDEAVPEGSTSP